jgi:hypothetical protein
MLGHNYFLCDEDANYELHLYYKTQANSQTPPKRTTPSYTSCFIKRCLCLDEKMHKLGRIWRVTKDAQNTKQATQVIEKHTMYNFFFKSFGNLGLDCKHECIIMAVLKLSSRVGMTIIKHTLIGGAGGGQGGQSPYIQTPFFFSFFFSSLLVPGNMDQPKNKNRYLKFSVHDPKLATEKVVYYCRRLVGEKYLDFVIHWVSGVGFFFFLILIFFLGFGNSSTIHLTS